MLLGSSRSAVQHFDPADMLQVAAEALIATEQELRAKLCGLDEEIGHKRGLLGVLMKRHDDATAELAGADANLSSAGEIPMPWMSCCCYQA